MKIRYYRITTVVVPVQNQTNRVYWLCYYFGFTRDLRQTKKIDENILTSKGSSNKQAPRPDNNVLLKFCWLHNENVHVCSCLPPLLSSIKHPWLSIHSHNPAKNICRIKKILKLHFPIIIFNILVGSEESLE